MIRYLVLFKLTMMKPTPVATNRAKLCLKILIKRVNHRTICVKGLVVDLRIYVILVARELDLEVDLEALEDPELVNE